MPLYRGHKATGGVLATPPVDLIDTSWFKHRLSDLQGFIVDSRYREVLLTC